MFHFSDFLDLLSFGCRLQMTSTNFNAYLFFVLCYLQLSLSVGENEFYCKAVPEVFRICNRCPDVKEKCEEPEEDKGCHCENIEIYSKSSEFTLKISPSCQKYKY